MRLVACAALLQLSGANDGDLLCQVKDAKMGMVAKVVSQNTTRMLVLAKADDLSAPESYDWWMSHEIQGAVTCGPVSSTSFLQRQAPPQGACAGACSACVPRLEDGALTGYFRSMAALAALDTEGHPRKAGRTLVVGLGAGVLPTWLVSRTEARVDVVDISEAVVQVSGCFGLTPGPRLGLHVEDGRKYLEAQQASSYETLVVDAFDEHSGMPRCMRSVEFFELVASRLTPGGVLLLNLQNCASTSDQDQESDACERFRLSVLSAVQGSFAETYLAEVPNSFGSQSVLVGVKDGQGDTATSDAPSEAVTWFKDASLRRLNATDSSLREHDQGC